MNEASVQEYLSRASERLTAQGFTCEQEVSFAGQTFRCVGHRARFELTKFGFAETFFVFGQFASIDLQQVRAFSGRCFQYALSARKISLPRGVFAGVYCYAVALAGQVDADTIAGIQALAPESHWASAEIPVVRDISSNGLYYFQRTPVWGAAYYAGYRRAIRGILA